MGLALTHCQDCKHGEYAITPNSCWCTCHPKLKRKLPWWVRAELLRKMHEGEADRGPLQPRRIPPR